MREREIRALREAVPGLDTYLDPFDSHPVELPSGAVTYWTNPEGRIVSSEEFSFGRPAGLDEEWRQMRRRAPKRAAGPVVGADRSRSDRRAGLSGRRAGISSETPALRAPERRSPTRRYRFFSIQSVIIVNRCIEVFPPEMEWFRPG